MLKILLRYLIVKKISILYRIAKGANPYFHSATHTCIQKTSHATAKMSEVTKIQVTLLTFNPYVAGG